IGLLRHAKVIYRSSFFSSGKLFDEARTRYDSSPVEIIKWKIKIEDFPSCYASSQSRAVETAKMIYNGKFIITDQLMEVKSAALFKNNTSLPSILRSIIGRIAWFVNYKKMPETRKESTERAAKFIRSILSQHPRNTLLVTHGFFMHCLKAELRKHRFKGHLPVFPVNGFLYLFEKEEN
ncbi:MAG TPA: histidine phosphatase family protein, partial [Bacteroidia bacterium]|nr:histidine phosphatase family protein [Bacteroidia bacterium]